MYVKFGLWGEKKVLHYYHSLSVFPQRDSIHFAMRGCSALPTAELQKNFVETKHVMGTVTLGAPTKAGAGAQPCLAAAQGAGGMCRRNLCVALSRGLGDSKMLKVAVTKLGAKLASILCPAAVLLQPVLLPDTLLGLQLPSLPPEAVPSLAVLLPLLLAKYTDSSLIWKLILTNNILGQAKLGSGDRTRCGKGTGWGGREQNTQPCNMCESWCSLSNRVLIIISLG